MSPCQGSRVKQQIVAGVLVVLMPYPALAAKWTVSPLLSLVESYTDNVSLKSGNEPKESQWITQINPGLSLSGTGKQLLFSLNYRMQSLFYLGHGDRNDIYHQLSTDTKATLVPRFLFLEASASQSQQVLSPDQRQSVNNLAINTGRQDVKSAKISPYIDTKIKRTIHAEIRATHDRVLYGESSGFDSIGDSAEMRLNSLASSFGDWSWGVHLTTQSVSYEQGPLSTDLVSEDNKDAVLDIGYHISRTIQFTGRSGYEDHDYKYTSSEQKLTDNYWQVGAVWQPNKLSSVRVGKGRRFFGKTSYFALEKKGKRNTLELGYDQTLATLRQYQIDTVLVKYIDAETNLPAVALVDNIIPINGVYVDNRTHAIWTHTARKLSTTLTFSHSRREYQLTNLEETVQLASLLMDEKLTHNSEATLNVSRQITKRDEGNYQFDVVSLTWNKSLGRSVTSKVDILRGRNSTTVIGSSNNYTENQVSASLNLKW